MKNWPHLVAGLLSAVTAVATPGSAHADGTAQVVETGVFESGVPAAADALGFVDGTVHYASFKSAESEAQSAPPKVRPIKRCLLTHGYSLGLHEIDYAVHRPFGEGFTYMEAFANLYFGKALIEGLLRDACETVFVTMQESDSTNLLELTRRTERFMLKYVCLGSDPKRDDGNPSGCALFGHSKGGAVAFNIARRCMEKRSEMGRAGCEELAKIYSASATTQGNAITALMYGVKILSEVKENTDGNPVLARYRHALDRLMHISAEATEQPPQEWDLFGDYVPGKRNPAWLDLSPIAPLEDGRPVFLVNDIVLKHRGWLRGEFVASTGDHQFSGASDDRMGCGTATPRPPVMLDIMLWSRQRTVCQAMDELLAAIHTPEGRTIFEVGSKAMLAYARSLYGAIVEDALRPQLDWLKFQHSDGMVDYDSSLAACLKALQQPGSAVAECKTLPGVNHAATNGTAQEAVDHIITTFKGLAPP